MMDESLFHKLEERCPFCKTEIIEGIYSAVVPHVWVWLVGTGDTQEEIIYCPICGKRLPQYPNATPKQFSVWYRGYRCYPYSLRVKEAAK